MNAGKNVPALSAKRDLMFSPMKAYKPEMFDFYNPTFEVNTNDLEAAFEATNLWNSMSKRLSDYGHSSSVGDIFERDGKFFMVDNFGFGEVAV